MTVGVDNIASGIKYALGYLKSLENDQPTDVTETVDKDIIFKESRILTISSHL